jgi:predicted Rossmann fold nucleotide-binding protein DprA/Smf involved in DNA uptake
VLFGVGDCGLLDLGGLSIVGSRNVDADGEVFTRMVAQTCARDGLPVVSGGARGVDQTAMFTALEAGGKVVGVLADSLQKASLTGKYRTGIREKRLALVSPFHPDARFNVGNAMGRNKYIYALSDFALIISAEVKKGGTWAGATEELKRTSARPVYVRMAEVVPQGNRDLMNLGARSFPPPPWDNDLKNLLSQAKVTSQKNRTPLQQSLFGGDDVQPVEVEMVKEEPRSYPEVTEIHPPPSHPALGPHESKGLPNIYEIVRPVILRSMEDWISAAELAEKLNVRKGQLEDWLKQAVKDAVIEKKSRPVRYRRK